MLSLARSASVSNDSNDITIFTSNISTSITMIISNNRVVTIYNNISIITNYTIISSISRVNTINSIICTITIITTNSINIIGVNNININRVNIINNINYTNITGCNINSINITINSGVTTFSNNIVTIIFNKNNKNVILKKIMQKQGRIKSSKLCKTGIITQNSQSLKSRKFWK